MINKIKKWMDWRGVTVKDALYGLFALGALVSTTAVFVYLLVTSLNPL